MLNFIRMAQDLRIPYVTEGHHHTHEGWIQTHCPQCTDGRHGYHLGFSLERGNMNCWRCGPVKIVNAIMGLARVSRERAWGIIRQYGDARKGGKPAERRRKRDKVRPPPNLGPLLPIHLRYLRTRGLPLSCVKEWDLQGTGPLSGSWNWRVVGPIRNKQGVTVAYVGRSIHPHCKPKYRLTEDGFCGENPMGFLYGEHLIPGDSVIVVEGPADAWNLGVGVVATLGIDWKPEQAEKLRQYRRRFILFDPETRAQRKAHKLAEWLSQFPGETEVISGFKSDPGSLDRKTVRGIRKSLLGRS